MCKVYVFNRQGILLNFNLLDIKYFLYFMRLSLELTEITKKFPLNRRERSFAIGRFLKLNIIVIERKQLQWQDFKDYSLVLCSPW